MMENALYFILKVLSIFKILRFFSWSFGHVEKIAWLEDKVYFKIYDATSWFANNYYTHIAKYLTM